MNWKLILLLSSFGLVMGFATVFVVPANVEPLFWLVIFVICAVAIAKQTATAESFVASSPRNPGSLVIATSGWAQAYS